MGNKKVLFYFYLVTLLLLANCQSKQLPKNFWQGEWTVSTVSYKETPNGDATIVGYLSIEEDQYNFTATGPNSEIQKLVQRLWFLNEPSGLIDVEVEVDSEQSLSGLEDGAVLARVKFGIGSGRENFQIRLNQDESKLYFHGEIAEFQFWKIEKDLSES